MCANHQADHSTWHLQHHIAQITSVTSHLTPHIAHLFLLTSRILLLTSYLILHLAISHLTSPTLPHISHPAPRTSHLASPISQLTYHTLTSLTSHLPLHNSYLPSLNTPPPSYTSDLASLASPSHTSDLAFLTSYLTPLSPSLTSGRSIRPAACPLEVVTDECSEYCESVNARFRQIPTQVYVGVRGIVKRRTRLPGWDRWS